MKQPITFQETLHTLHFIWEDKTSFEIFGMEAKKTKKQIYQEIFGKKARKHYAKQYSFLTRQEIGEIIKTHAEHLKTAIVVMHATPLLDGDLRRANFDARKLASTLALKKVS